MKGGVQPFNIDHETHVGLIDPDTAFWALVEKKKMKSILEEGSFLASYEKKAGQFAKEMKTLRFELKPSAVYFNPTERCNLNCAYCYIPKTMRRGGRQMSGEELLAALEKLKSYFKEMPAGRLPQVIFHGAEPLLNRQAVFGGIEKFKNSFSFGVQTNATLLDEEALQFLTSRGVGIGLSLDGPTAAIADRTRATWDGKGVYKSVVQVLKRLRGYESYNVIATITRENVSHLVSLVEFFHDQEVPTCMLNVVRCTQPGAQPMWVEDAEVAKHYVAALDRSYELYLKTGRKLVVANFANILIGIVAPTARRLMCDISPCGGGRSFFALAPNGDLFPCSEFIGLPKFRGGNLFRDPIEKILESAPFRSVTYRKAEDFEPCRHCPIRHFCGSPCPAEVDAMHGEMNHKGAYCKFYEEQVRYAFRLIADGKENAFLWDGWDEGTQSEF